MFKNRPKTGIKIVLSRLWGRQESSIVLITTVIIIVVQLYNNVFLSSTNVINILRSSAYLLIPALGMTFILISGNIDISISTVMAMGGIVCCMMIDAGLPIFIAVVISLGISAVIGFINGYLIVKFNIPSMIMTLGMQYIAKGVVYVLTKGAPIYPLPKEFLALDKMRFFGIPSIVCVAFVFACVFYVISGQTRFGREMYAVGGNRNAARLSGISAKKVVIVAYILIAALSVFTGIAMAARVGSAQSTSGVGYELNAIVACLIGGTSILGGSGNILGTVIGAVFIQVLQNGLLMLHVSVYWQQLIVGVVVVLAVVWDQYKRMLQMRKL